MAEPARPVPMTVIESNMRLQFPADTGQVQGYAIRPGWARNWPLGRVDEMPIYEYVCMSCESHFEELVGMSDPDPACPDCGKTKVAKQFSTSFAAHGMAGQPSFGGGGCCGGSCGSCG
jgi:putative FmdB family regulatory protein